MIGGLLTCLYMLYLYRYTIKENLYIHNNISFESHCVLHVAPARSILYRSRLHIDEFNIFWFRSSNSKKIMNPLIKCQPNPRKCPTRHAHQCALFQSHSTSSIVVGWMTPEDTRDDLSPLFNLDRRSNLRLDGTFQVIR